MLHDHHPYLGWEALPHVEGCLASGWLVHERSRPRLGVERLELRVVCTSCGAVHHFALDGREGRIEREITTTVRIGFGAAPIRSAGLWLWAGRIPDGGTRPAGYLVTTVKTSPSSRAEVAGSVSRYRTPRGAVRWMAAVGYSPAVTNQEGFRTVRAAASWLAAELSRSAGDGRGAGTPGAEADR